MSVADDGHTAVRTTGGPGGPGGSPRLTGVRTRAARARSAAAPVLDVVQPVGWAVLGVGLVALVVALRLDWREVAVIGIAAVLVFLLAVPWLLGRSDVHIDLDLEPQRVVAGHSVSAKLVVSNTGDGRQRGVLLDLPVGSGIHRYDVPPLAPDGSHEETFVIRTERRGVIPVGPATVRRGDPLGLMSRDATWGGVTEVLVRPPMVAVESLGTGLLRDLEGATTDKLSESDLAFHALREYVPGDDLRHIHWRSSAKLAGTGNNQLLVRQYLDSRRSHATFVVDDRRAAWAGEDDFETALAAVSSLIGRAILDEISATFVCGDRASSGGVGQAALDMVCRAGYGSTGLVDAALTASIVAPDTSLLFLFGGPGTDFATYQRAAAISGPDVRTFAITVDPAAKSRVVEATGLLALNLTKLDDLPGLLHWSVA